MTFEEWLVKKHPSWEQRVNDNGQTIYWDRDEGKRVGSQGFEAERDRYDNYDGSLLPDGTFVWGNAGRVGHFDYNGQEYGQTGGGSYQDLMQVPLYANVLRATGVSPDQFVKTPEYGWAAPANVTDQTSKAFSDDVTARRGPLGGALKAFGSTIGLAMGASGLAGAGLGALAEGGSTLAGSFLPEGGYQSLFSSLGANAAENGGSFGSLFSQAPAPVTEGAWNMTGGYPQSWNMLAGEAPSGGMTVAGAGNMDYFDIFRDLYGEVNAPSNLSSFDQYLNPMLSPGQSGFSQSIAPNFIGAQSAATAAGLGVSGLDALMQGSTTAGSLPSGSGAWDFLKGNGSSLAKLLLGSKAGAAFGSGGLSGLFDSDPFGADGILGLGARLAPGYAALKFAQDQGGVDTSALSSQLNPNSVFSSPFDTSKSNALYGQVGNMIDPYKSSALQDYDLRTGAARGELLGNLDRRGVSGSSFGNADLYNFDIGSQAARGKLAGDIGFQGASLMRGLAQDDVNAQQAQRQQQLGYTGNQTMVASQLLDAQLKQKAIQSALFGRAYDILGRAVSPSPSLFGAR